LSRTAVVVLSMRGNGFLPFGLSGLIFLSP
jgi:hypothetical protein